MTEVLVDPDVSSGQIALLSGPDELFVVAFVKLGVITCVRFSATGTRFGDFTVNDADAPATWPVVAGLPEGFVVAWISGVNLFLQRMDLGGARIGKRIRVNAGVVDPTSPPALTRLVDGAVVVCWADGSQEAVRGQVFRGDLSRLGTPFAVNVPTDGNFGTAGSSNPVPHGPVNLQPAVTLLGVADTGHAYVVAWRRGTAVDVANTAHFRFFYPGDPNPLEPPPAPPAPPVDRGGNPITDEHMADHDFLCLPNALTVGPNGGFCTLRVEGGPNFRGAGSPADSNFLIIQWFGSDGSPGLSDNVTHRTDNTLSVSPVITSTPTGDLLVVWALVDQHSATPGTFLKGYVRGMGPGGPNPGPAPVPVTIATLQSGPPSGPPSTPRVTCVQTDAGFRTVVAWVEGTALKVRILQGNDLLHDV